MSAPQFTPGPWVADEFCEENDQATRVGTYDGTPTYYHRTATVALCLTNHDDDEPATVPRIGIVAAEANARLIAAAPQLYDACVDTLDALNRLRDGFELSPRNAVRDAALLMIDQHVDLLETALFKARGDQ